MKSVILMVLVLDGAKGSTLVVPRSLGRIQELHIITAGSAPEALAGCSRYSRRYLQSPNPEREPEAYVAWLQDLVAQTSFAMVLPVTEITSQLLLMNSERLAGVHPPFAPYRTVMALAVPGRGAGCAGR